MVKINNNRRNAVKILVQLIVYRERGYRPPLTPMLRSENTTLKVYRSLCRTKHMTCCVFTRSLCCLLLFGKENTHSFVWNEEWKATDSTCQVQKVWQRYTLRFVRRRVLLVREIFESDSSCALNSFWYISYWNGKEPITWQKVQHNIRMTVDRR